MNDAALHTEALEMGISHADFFRIFPRVVAPAEVRREALAVHVETGPGRGLTVRLSPEKTRRIAGLGIPYTELELAFRGYDAPARAAFLAHFHRAFQKGGG